MVYRLHKALYGLKQTPIDCNLKIISFFKNLGFKKCEMEYDVYVVFLHVDDILLTGSCTSEINKLKKVLMNAFDMTDLENIVYFLGMEIFHFDKEIIVH